MKTAKSILAVVSAFALISSTSHAAIITWGLPTNISGDSDVSTAGTLFQAANVGDGTTPSPTINGVTFPAFVMGSGPSFTLGDFTLACPSWINGYSGYGYGSGPFSGLSSAYQGLLGYGNYGNAAAVVMTLTITNLTIGNSYQFQWWVNDSRQVWAGQTVDATAGNSVTLDANTTEAAGGIGQHVLGTFVADGTSQTIDFQGNAGNATLQNAYQLRDITPVPEPASATLLMLGAAALAARRRRSTIIRGG